MATWIPRAFTSRPRSRLGKIGVESISRATLRGSSSKIAAIRNPWRGEPLLVEKRRDRVAEPDQRHRPLAIEAENALELGLEPGDVVADPANAELAEVRQVLADLRRVQIEALGQLLRRDGLDAVLFELQQAPGVDRETTDRHLGDPRQAGVGAWRHRAAGPAPIARGAPGPRYSLDFTKIGCPSRTAGSTR